MKHFINHFSKLNISKACNRLLVKLKHDIKIQKHDFTGMVKCMDIQWYENSKTWSHGNGKMYGYTMGAFLWLSNNI